MKGEIVFKNKGNIIQIDIESYIYNGIEKLGKDIYSDSRRINGLLKTYALVVLYSKVSRISSGWTPIHNSDFETLVSKRYFKEYLNLLHSKGYLDYKKYPVRVTTNKFGKEHNIKKPTNYKLNIVGCLYNDSKPIPVVFKCNEDMWLAIKMKYDNIKSCYNALGMDSKREKIMNTSWQSIITTRNICELVKKIYYGKIKSPNTISKNIDSISKYSILTIKEINDILIKLLEVLKKEENSVQYIENKLNHSVKNQKHTKNLCSKLHYYQDVYVDIGIFEKCYCIGDLKHIIRLTKVPAFKDNGKLYSAFANLRRPLREYVCYNGYGVKEATDISCAHFAMLPIIFQMYNITIPFGEMIRWKFLTQKVSKEEDKRLGLYTVVAEYGKTSRDVIKPTFQSFFSLKNEKSYTYYGMKNNDPNRRIVCEFFKDNYPNIYQALLTLNRAGGPTLKSVANKVESDIINPICDRLRSNGLHPFRVQDAIYLPSNEMPLIDFNIRKYVFDYINGYKAISNIA